MRRMKSPNTMPLLAIAIMALVTLPIVGCPKPQPVPPTPDADAGDDPDADVDAAAAPTCANWCKHAAKLGCDAAKPTPHGASCVTVCSNLVANSGTPPNLRCRIASHSCVAADLCEAGR